MDAMTQREQVTDAAPEAAWRGFVARFVAIFVGALALALALIVLIDPYDSGRFPSLGLAGIADDTQRTANVSLGRSGKFDAAIFGNSHGQLLDPERLSQATGLSFVQLAIPGANAPEQMAMIHWFVRHHARIGAIVLAADDRWCSADPQPWKWFPFWLYGDSDIQYLRTAFSARTLEAAARRIKHVFGLVHPSDPRGYDDYERGLPPNYRFVPPPVAERQDAIVASPVLREGRPFPAIDRLAEQLADLPARVPVVILFPPRYVSDLPVDPDVQAVLAECKSRLARLTVQSPRGGFLDYLVASPMTRDPGNFEDAEHYRAPVARTLERAIAEVLRGQGAESRVR